MLLIFCHLDLIRGFDERNLFLALGSLKVIHLLRETVELALHVLSLLDLLLDGVLHEATLVDLLTLLELDLKTLLAFTESLVTLLRLCNKRESFLLLLLFHLLKDAFLLA